MNTIARILLTTSFLLAISGCARREDDSADDEAPAMLEPSAQETPGPTMPASQPSKVVAPIKVEVTLSPAAQAELSAKSEGIVVEAVYGGDPTADSFSQANEFGLIELGRTEQQIPSTGGEAFLSEDVIDRNRLSLVAGQPQVMINVRSALKSAPKNLLSCDLYWDSVQAASTQPIGIPCKLLSERSTAN